MVTSSNGTATNLREIFTPLFSYALFLARSPARQHHSFGTVRGDVEQLLAKQQELVNLANLSQTDYENARFAVIAWLDELLLRSTYTTNKELYQQWVQQPLAVKIYQDFNAGVNFFDRLKQLHPGQKDIREIYYLCLCLGFCGRYVGNTAEDRLFEVRRDLALHLPTPPSDLIHFQREQVRLTPQPYEVEPIPQRPLPRPPSLLWAVLPLLMVVAFAIYYFRPVEPPPPPPLTPGDIEAVLQGFSCCQISVTEIHNGMVRLDGQVESETQRQQVEQTVRKVGGVTDVQTAFTLIPRPFCEVIALLKPYHVRSETLGTGLRVHPQNGCDATYSSKNDKNLIVDVSAQKSLAHTYIDYYVADRTLVAHLLPHPLQPNNALNTDTSMTIGGPNSKVHVNITPPFGMELVTVITSPQPLFSQPLLMEAEPAVTYLEKLRQVLPTDSTTAEVTADYCFLTTAE